MPTHKKNNTAYNSGLAQATPTAQCQRFVAIAKPQNVSCYFTDHSESLDLTTNFSSSTFDNGQRNATVLVCSEYLVAVNLYPLQVDKKQKQIT